MTDLDAAVPLTVVRYSDAQLETLLAKVSFYRRAIMRKGALAGADADVPQPGVLNVLVCHARADADLDRPGCARRSRRGPRTSGRQNALFDGLDRSVRDGAARRSAPAGAGRREAAPRARARPTRRQVWRCELAVWLTPFDLLVHGRFTQNSVPHVSAIRQGARRAKWFRRQASRPGTGAVDDRHMSASFEDGRRGFDLRRPLQQPPGDARGAGEAARLGIPRDRVVCTGDIVAYCADPVGDARSRPRQRHPRRDGQLRRATRQQRRRLRLRVSRRQLVRPPVSGVVRLCRRARDAGTAHVAGGLAAPPRHRDRRRAPRRHPWRDRARSAGSSSPRRRRSPRSASSRRRAATASSPATAACRSPRSSTAGCGTTPASSACPRTMARRASGTASSRRSTAASRSAHHALDYDHAARRCRDAPGGAAGRIRDGARRRACGRAAMCFRNGRSTPPASRSQAGSFVWQPDPEGARQAARRPDRRARPLAGRRARQPQAAGAGKVQASRHHRQGRAARARAADVRSTRCGSTPARCATSPAATATSNRARRTTASSISRSTTCAATSTRSSATACRRGRSGSPAASRS